MESIVKYFKGLNDHQIQQLSQLKSLYEEWNEKINVISRKDMDDFYLHHVLHSLTLTSFTKFTAGTKILDLGCGGGFPGIPLAIFYPEVHFTLIDGTGKKIKGNQCASFFEDLGEQCFYQSRLCHIAKADDEAKDQYDNYPFHR